MSKRTFASILALLLVCAPQFSGAETALPPCEPESEVPELTVEQYRLDNGLTVLLSQDSRLPIVTTELVYLVGSSHETKGRTGFAHLFEHLMFQGSKHHDSEYFAPFEPIGGQVNGTTSQDRTNYYEQVPKQYLELALWMESDRLRTLPDVLTQEKLDNQRDVVKNERRQRYEITPYGMAHWYLSEALYPVDHPYRHTPIGSHEDLSAATLKDVREFFRKYYVASNAALIVAGDFDVKPTKALIEKYFKDIPSGQRAATPQVYPVILSEPQHWVAEDDVELPRVYLAFHTPALFEPGDAELDLLSSVLTEGKSSRLFQRLVYEGKVAKDVVAYQMSQKLAGAYVVQATAAPGVSVETLGDALIQALRDSLELTPSAAELTRARNDYKKDFFHRMEGVAEKASLIGSYFVHVGHGNYVDEDFSRYLAPTPGEVLAAGRQYLDLSRAVRLDFIPGKKGAPLRKVEPTSLKPTSSTSTEAPHQLAEISR